MIDLSDEIQAFEDAIYGKDVRSAMVSAAEEIQEQVNNAIENQLIEVDDTLSVEGAGADAKAVGDRTRPIDGLVRESNVLYQTTPTKLERGITFTPQSDGGIAVSGTASAISFYTFYNDTASLPDWMSVGDEYYIDYSAENVSFHVYFYDSNQSYISDGSVSTRVSRFVTVPESASGVIVRIAVNSGTSANETVYPVLRFAHYSDTDNSKTVGEFLPEPIKMSSGKYIECGYAVGTAITDSDYHESDIYECAMVECDAGDTFLVNALSLGTQTLAILDADKKVIVRSQNFTLCDNTRVVVPDDGKYIVINNLTNNSDGIKRTSYKAPQFEYSLPLAVTGNVSGYHIRNTDGEPMLDSTRMATGYIEVDANTTYSVAFAYIAGLASICEYDPTRTFIRAAVSDSNPSGSRKKPCGVTFTTSEQTRFIRVSGYLGFTPQICKVRTVESNSKEIDGIKQVRSKIITPSTNPVLIKDTVADGLALSGISGSDENTEVTACGKNIFNVPETRAAAERNGVNVYYDSDAKSIRITSSGATANTATGKNGTVNDSELTLDFKFRFKGQRYITISPNCPDSLIYYEYGKEFPVYLQITDGTNIWNMKGSDAITIYTSESTEYGVRFIVLSGWSGDLTFYPQIEIGTMATPFEKYQGVTVGISDIGQLQSYEGVTTVYTNDDTSMTVTAWLMTDNDKQQKIQTVVSNISDINPNFVAESGNAFISPRKKIKDIGAMLCFVDDDTSNLNLVQTYHDCFLGDNNELMGVGNYAVMTNRLDLYPDTLVPQLLDYEKEGFGMLYHCNNQQGATETSPGACYLPEYRDILDAEDDFVTGLRKMQTYGFSDYKYWVTPYGVNDEEIQRLAKRHGMNCLMTMGQQSFITPSNANRWNIPRLSFSSSEDNTDSLKKSILRCIDSKGMIIITTHANAWGTGAADRFKSLVEYCNSLNHIRIVSLPEAFNTYFPLFILNELF